MGIFDIFRVGKIRAELEQVKKQRDKLKAIVAETDRMEAYGLKKAIEVLTAKKDQTIRDVENVEAIASKRRQALEQDLEDRKKRAAREMQDAEAQVAKKRAALDRQISDLNREIENKKKHIIILDEEALLQEFGFYKPRYDLASSEQYKFRLERVRKDQEAMVKAGKSVYSATAWTVNNSQKEGERMIRDYVKLILRSFNNECDASITNVKFNNIDSIEKKLRKAFETLNKLGERMSIAIAPQYLNLKLEELYLCHEYQVKKQQEREEQRRIREQMREEAKLMKEIEEMKQKLEKEEKHFTKAIESISARLQQTETAAERDLLEAEKAKIEQKLAEVEKNKLSVELREQNTRAGYVYIISNIGSFGENVYKIGVTRRLDPQERVDELGDASVPFRFDVHAVIFSEDAPKLEHALHKAFEHRRLNMINRRREFFRVSLEEIENVVRTNFSKPVEFMRLAEADEYRESLVLKATSAETNAVYN
jgi:hypothetical protein